jgi:hypothetical protein
VFKKYSQSNKAIFITFIFLSLFPKAYAIDVYNSGFSYLGAANTIKSSFPYSYKLNGKVDGIGLFDKELSKKINAESYNFNLITNKLADLDDESAVSFTFALQNERTSIEKIGNLHKLLIQLDGQLLFFDFHSMSIVASFPVNIQYNDVVKSYPSEDYIKEQYRKIFFDKMKVNLFTSAVKRLKEVTLKRRYKNYIQVVDSQISNKAFAQSTIQTGIERKRLTQVFAQSFSQFLSSNQDISVLPFIKGHAIGNKLSGKYSNGEVYTLELPEPDYAVKLDVLAFKRKLFSEENAGKSYIYAAQASFDFYEPLSGKSYFREKLFNGSTKVIPSSQTSIDHWATFNESLMILFDKFTKQLNSPTKQWLKKHSGSTKGYKSFKQLKEIINRCR